MRETQRTTRFIQLDESTLLLTQMFRKRTLEGFDVVAINGRTGLSSLTCCSHKVTNHIGYFSAKAQCQNLKFAVFGKIQELENLSLLWTDTTGFQVWIL